MDLKSEVNQERICVAVHAAAAIAMGYVSVIIAVLASKYVALAAGFLILLVVGFLAERLLGKKGVKWWLANGLVIYLIVWFVNWVFFLNL